jgi:hypothetical protein
MFVVHRWDVEILFKQLPTTIKVIGEFLHNY